MKSRRPNSAAPPARSSSFVTLQHARTHGSSHGSLQGISSASNNQQIEAPLTPPHTSSRTGERSQVLVGGIPAGSGMNLQSSTPPAKPTTLADSKETAIAHSATMLLRRHTTTGQAALTPSAPSVPRPPLSSSSSPKATFVMTSASAVPPPSHSIIVRRKQEEKAANPERLNLDRKRLTLCPTLEGEEKLKLLNFQNNSITGIRNLTNLPCLVFLDLYNNSITEIDGLESVPTLRVLMLGKNRISSIRNLERVPRLDVLDLHNNAIEKVENLNHLHDLRVLNLAGNKITTIEGSEMEGMRSLAEVNFRRNLISNVVDMHKAPSLQRVFLSANHIHSFSVLSGVLALPHLVELSLDGNPVCSVDGYRLYVVHTAPNLRHLDMRRVTDDERRNVEKAPDLSAVSVPATESQAVILGSRLSSAGLERGSRAQSDSEGSQSTAPAHNATSGQGREDSDDAKEDDVASVPAPSAQSNSAVAMLFAPAKPRAALPSVPSIVEYDVGNRRLYVTGNNADSTLERMPVDAITEVYFDAISCERAVRVFGPKLQRFTSLHTYRFTNNAITSLDQLTPLCSLPRLLHLEIQLNEIIDTMPSLTPMLCSAMLPQLLTFNGKEASATETQRNRLLFSGVPRPMPLGGSLLSGVASATNPIDVSALFPQLQPYDAQTARVCDGEVQEVIRHCTTVDKKLRLLNGHWPSILHRIVEDTLQRMSDPPRHDEMYKLT